MAIVADHLGLSWTELARELNFSVDEINQIRVENPNSLIAQSFMLLKKWVSRDGKNATTDALTSVLTKINRIDIVTLLEGPIFDYGNISGTRSFADENNIFHDPVDGYPTIQVELETPTGLRFVPTTHSHQEDVFSDFSSIESPFRTPSRLSDVLVTSQGIIDDTAAGPPVVTEEDTSLEDGKHDFSVPREATSKDAGQIRLEEMDLNDYPRYLGSYAGVPKQELSEETSPTLVRSEQRKREKSGSDEELTEEKLKSLFEDIHLEEAVESEEMTEEKVLSILKYVQQAEQELSSITGWQSEASSGNVEPPTPGRRITGELLDRLDDSPDQCRDSITSYLKGEAGKLESNGSYSESTMQAKTKPVAQESVNSLGKQSDKETTKPKMQSSARTEQQTLALTSHQKLLLEASKPAADALKTSVPVSVKKMSWNTTEDSKLRQRAQEEEGAAAAEQKEFSESDSDSDIEIGSDSSSEEEQKITTRVYRRRLILKGEEAKNIPGESVTEEQFTDEEGNVITRKQGEGYKVKMKKEIRHVEKTTYS